MSLIEWITNIQSKTVWRDREYNIYDEDYTKTKGLKFFKIPLFKITNHLNMKHSLDDFRKHGDKVGFKKNE